MIRTLICLSAAVAVGAAAYDVEFERLGPPTKPRPLENLSFVTSAADHGVKVWGIRDIMIASEALGINTATGKTTVFDFTKYGRAQIQQAPNGNLYFHSASTRSGGLFFKYDAAADKLIKLGVSSKTAQYMLRTLMTDDGIFYVPSYPKTELNILDTNTDTIKKSVVIGSDKRQNYISSICEDAAKNLFMVLGLHHTELWSYQPATGEKKQILPEQLVNAPKRVTVTLFTGVDGHVYAVVGDKKFVCRPDRLEQVEKLPAAKKGQPILTPDGKVPVRVTSEGELELKDAKSGQITRIKTDVPPTYSSIYTVGCEYDGWIYGGAFGPATAFRCRPATGEMQDLGVITAGTIQIYDVIPVKDGVLFSSYMSGNLDFYHPATGKMKHVRNMTATSGQERAPDMTRAGNGKIYGGTLPIKGHLGGAIFELDPETFAGREWVEVVPKQSIQCVAPVKDEKNLIFAGSNIAGGTSAEPEAKEACVLLFDVENGKTVWEAKPLPGEKNYHFAVTAKNGLIYGIGATTRKFYVVDPAQRKVTAVGDIPGEGTIRLCRQLAPDGSIIGIVGKDLLAINPADHTVKVIASHDSLAGIINQVYLAPDGTLYYGGRANLWKAKLKPAQ